MMNAVILSAVLSQQPAGVPELPRNVFLVRAVVTDMKYLGKRKMLPARWTMTIDKVYLGPDDLKKKTFFYDDIPLAVRDRPVYGLKMGAVGLWWVYRFADVQGTHLRPELGSEIIDKYRIRPFPFLDTKDGSTFDFVKQHDGHAEYKVGLAWAEAIERVGKAADAEARKRLLEELAKSKTAPIAKWAQNLLNPE